MAKALRWPVPTAGFRLNNISPCTRYTTRMRWAGDWCLSCSSASATTMNCRRNSSRTRTFTTTAGLSTLMTRYPRAERPVKSNHQAVTVPLKFYSAWYCPFAQRVWMALLHKGLAFEYIEVSWSSESLYPPIELSTSEFTGVIVSFNIRFQQNSFSEVTMLAYPQPTRIDLPNGRQSYVKSAVLQVIALTQYAIEYVRVWANHCFYCDLMSVRRAF